MGKIKTKTKQLIKATITAELFVFNFLSALGLCCCAWAVSSCGEWGLLFVGGRRLLSSVASLVAEHGL